MPAPGLVRTDDKGWFGSFTKIMQRFVQTFVSQDLWDNVQPKIIICILSLREEYSRLVHILQN
jgi:hypothetical protein